MAVNPAGTIFKSLTFDGKTSREYGVHITGEAVFNAPERDVEMISIPGRNGAFALDHGHFNNIEVTYPAGVFAEDERDFADAVSDFRNWLCSRSGYCRLTDDYNPNEYRLAVYKSGLEVSPALLRAGEFEIVFDCKPQRYLTSGETKLTVTNNSTVTNPTLFASSPMLEVTGYGSVYLGSQDEIYLNNILIGYVLIANGKTSDILSTGSSSKLTLETAQLNTGDTITLNAGCKFKTVFSNDSEVVGAEHVSSSGSFNYTFNYEGSTSAGRKVTSYTIDDDVTFTFGTSSTQTQTFTFTAQTSLGGGTNYTVTDQCQFIYNGSNRIDMKSTVTVNTLKTQPQYVFKDCYGDSTQTALGTPTYIDLDIGEAYKIKNDEYISLNNAVTIPAELPTLPSGNTTVTFDNTVTSLKIVPRWWKV